LLRIRAGRVHPVTAPSFEDGAVLVNGEGRIAAVGANADVPTPHAARAFHFPDAELLPGLVNCHTHLELTQLGGGAKHEEPEFHKWIWHVRTLKDATSAEAFYEAALAGVRECWARGVTCIAETGSTGAVMRAVHDFGGRGIVYHETFGPDPAQCAESMRELEAAVLQLRRLATSQLRLGVSPHAPYSVSAPLYRASAAFARRERLPLAVHIAESQAETDFVRDGAGPFATLFGKRSIPVEAQHRSPVAYLAQLGVLGRDTLCIHCVQVDDGDIELLRTAGAAVAHCPLSNTAHGHGRSPFDRFRKVGVPVGLGTDSVISVGELDLWAEADAAGLRGDAARRALTIEGARALAWDREIGSLEVGKAADLALFSSSDLHHPSPTSKTSLLTVVSGKIVHQISGQ
jgi:cytosine/adenosine deaminase-related metal-dependent hydrolase